MSNRLTSLPDEIGLLSELRKLLAGQNEIATLPDTIGDLAELLELKLDRNKLVTLPATIGKLSKLRELDVSGNSIVTLPPQINGLVSLTSLDLDGNKSLALPSNMRGLRSMERLSLASCGLVSAPLEIAHLSSLTFLDLRGNMLSSLPKDWSYGLKRVSELCLTSNQLPSVPPVIGEMTSLRLLWLNNNNIESIPEPVFPKLACLTKLYLYSNEIASLPESIGALTALEVLELNYNKLRSLPESIGQLHALRELKLKDNLLESLPASFGSLRELSNLDIRGNKLTALPPSMCNCSQLTRCVVGGNPLESNDEWKEALLEGTTGILALLRRQHLGESGAEYEEDIVPDDVLSDLPVTLGTFTLTTALPQIRVDAKLALWMGKDEMVEEVGGRRMSGYSSPYFVKAAVVNPSFPLADLPPSYDIVSYVDPGWITLERIGDYRFMVQGGSFDASGEEIESVNVSVDRMPADSSAPVKVVPVGAQPAKVWLSTHRNAKADIAGYGTLSVELVHSLGDNKGRASSIAGSDTSANGDDGVPVPMGSPSAAPAARSSSSLVGMQSSQSQTQLIHQSAPLSSSSSSSLLYLSSGKHPVVTGTSPPTAKANPGSAKSNSNLLAAAPLRSSQSSLLGSRMDVVAPVSNTTGSKWTIFLRGKDGFEHKLQQASAPGFRRFLHLGDLRVDIVRYHLCTGTSWAQGRPGRLEKETGNLIPDIAVCLHVTRRDTADIKS